MKKSNKYNDDDHDDDNTTSCFQGAISADEVPYIVVPKGKEKFKFSSGVIIDSEGNYLYCVVAEIGKKKRGMGEVSIYAAWRAMEMEMPPKLNEKGGVIKSYRIGNVNQSAREKYNLKHGLSRTKKHKRKKMWRIIVFRDSSPKPKAKTKKFGWKYNKTPEEFEQQIVEVGRECYRGIGNCLNRLEENL